MLFIVIYMSIYVKLVTWTTGYNFFKKTKLPWLEALVTGYKYFPSKHHSSTEDQLGSIFSCTYTFVCHPLDLYSPINDFQPTNQVQEPSLFRIFLCLPSSKTSLSTPLATSSPPLNLPWVCLAVDQQTTVCTCRPAI